MLVMMVYKSLKDLLIMSDNIWDNKSSLHAHLENFQ